MSATLNTDLLASMIREKRGSNGQRQVADEIGNISLATISRIEQGKIPDVDTFIKICDWLNVPTETFVLRQEPLVSSSDYRRNMLIAHLRADKALPKETAQMLVQVIDFAYNNTKK
jgi:transcriptional regulator with XRE-family HTH domain